MPLYEHVYLARQDLSAQQVEELTAKLSGVITEAGGKIAKTEYWGLKSLTYRIRKNRKAHLTLLNIDAPPAALSEVERQERLSEDVLRYLSIRRRQCAEDRLQGRKAAATLRVGARQDRAEPHHGGVGQEAARTGAGDQALALPRPAALRN